MILVEITKSCPLAAQQFFKSNAIAAFPTEQKAFFSK